MSSKSNTKTRSQVGILLRGQEKEKRNTNNKSKLDKNLYENITVHHNNLISEMFGKQDEMLNAMSMEKLKAEITRLKEVTLFQSRQFTQLHNQVQDFSDNKQSTNDILQALTESFRSFNLDIKPLKFVENINPNQFLNKFEKFCVLKQITGSRLNFLDGAFDGRAKAWFESQRNAFINYNDFKEKFTSDFFSIPIRVKIKSAWLTKRFTPNKDTLQKYFLDQFNEVQYFLPKMEAYEFELHNSATNANSCAGNVSNSIFREL